MNYRTPEDIKYDRKAMRESSALLASRLNKMDAETKRRAERTIANLRGQIDALTDKLNWRGAE